MFRSVSMRRCIVTSFLFTCFLLLSAVSPVLASPNAKPLNFLKFGFSSNLQNNWQGQQLPITNYLALGDSLAYGYQPNGDDTQGYASDLAAALQSQGVTSGVDLGCPSETTSTFIAGGICTSYPLKSQLATALAYLQQVPAEHATLVTLDIGANDVLPDVKLNAQSKTCTVNRSAFRTALQILDQNLTQNILPQLHAALTNSAGQSTGTLLLLNYYDPFQNACPNTLLPIQMLNAHLARDIAGFGTPVDIFGAFGGPRIPNPNLCNYTWMCAAPPLGPNIHPTTEGYQVMANAIGYSYMQCSKYSDLCSILPNL
jgi:lysophospholipase L1-like esterase